MSRYFEAVYKDMMRDIDIHTYTNIWEEIKDRDSFLTFVKHHYNVEFTVVDCTIFEVRKGGYAIYKHSDTDVYFVNYNKGPIYYRVFTKESYARYKEKFEQDRLESEAMTETVNYKKEFINNFLNLRKIDY